MKVNWLGETQDITMVAANNTMQMKPGIRAVLLSTSVLAITSIAIPAASAEQDSSSSGYKLGSDITIEQAASLLHYSGGNDRFRVEIAPNYSEELGFSLKGAVGGYLTDAMALGLIVEYGENKREYLANAGIQFNESLSFVGTVGLLEEHNEYVDGEGREEAQQMEYGASLKGAYEVGFLSGFELNGYLADADSDSDSVETGKLYGVQLLAGLDLTETTHLKLGGGYEWLEWDDTNDDDSRWTFSADAAQQLGDVISLTGHARLGASEYVYGGGLAFDLSNGGMNTNSLGVNAIYIDGKNGIDDDQRIELSWTLGFGAGPSTSVAAADLTDKSGTIRAAADVAVVSPSSNLLNDVMKRPSFLPERALARNRVTTAEPIVDCDNTGIDDGNIEPEFSNDANPLIRFQVYGLTQDISSLLVPVSICIDGIPAPARAFEGPVSGGYYVFDWDSSQVAGAQEVVFTFTLGGVLHTERANFGN